MASVQPDKGSKGIGIVERLSTDDQASPSQPPHHRECQMSQDLFFLSLCFTISQDLLVLLGYEMLTAHQVLGSGVVAYQTALSLRMSRELRDCQVTLMPDQPRNEGNKHSKHNLSYASSKTDGVWRPHADGFYANVRDASSTIKAFEKRTYEYWSSIMPKDAFLYPSAGEAARRHHGLSVTTCKHYRGEGHADMSNGECPGLWWSNFVDSFQTVNLASQREKRSADEMKKVPDNATVGVQYNTFVFDPDTYLEGRARMAADFGVRIMEYRQLVMDNRDTDLVQSIKRNLHFQLDREDDFDERALRWIANPFRMRNRVGCTSSPGSISSTNLPLLH